MLSRRLGPTHSRDNALLDRRPLELRNCPEDVQQEAARRRGRVDAGIAEGRDSDTPPGEGPEDAEEVGEGPGEPVDLPHRHDVELDAWASESIQSRFGGDAVELEGASA